jgi:hypothetical protein
MRSHVFIIICSLFSNHISQENFFAENLDIFKAADSKTLSFSLGTQSYSLYSLATAFSS